jgi:cytochrome c553
MRLSPPGLLLAGIACVHAPAVAQEGPSPLPRAEALLGERNCTACHLAPEAVLERLAPKAAPRLAGIGRRVTASYLEAFLSDPHGTRPDTSMPDLLAKLAPHDRAEVVEGLVHFLASLGGPLDLTPVGVRGGSLERGRRLFHSVGCVACHAPREEPWELELPLDEVRAARAAEQDASSAGGADEAQELYIAPGTLAPPDLPLDFLARKTTVAQLAAFLVDPLATRPAGRMPALGLTEKEALDIARYLLLDQASERLDHPVQGLVREYFEDPFRSERPDFDALEPVRVDVADDFDIGARDRDDHFGFRFSGSVDVPEEGEWTFYTTSDDGSQLWVAGEHVVDNGGNHPMNERSGTLHLARGRHSLVVTMYENQGGEGLAVHWSGPGVAQQALPAAALTHLGMQFTPPGAVPFTPDERLVLRGRQSFTGLGCNACHATGEAPVDELPKRGTAAGPELLALAPGGGGPCLGDAGSTGTRYRLAPEDFVALRELLLEDAAALGAPLASDERIARHLARNHCYGCHRREGVGGVHPLNKDYFQAAEGADLGDEGRYPPDLSGVGAKLRAPALRAVLLEGDGVRPYVTARMPQFGEPNVGWLTDAFAAVDGPHADRQPAGGLAPEVIRAGHRLAGVEGGLGCIQCHDFAGTPSLGIRAVDLARVYERIRPDYFRRLLRDPSSVKMNTRMAELWIDGQSPVRDVLGGDIDAQIDALWAYLSLGAAMPLPRGLSGSGSAYELVPAGDPLLCGVFMRGVSPRTLCVGFPELTHYAFDMQGSRLAKIWRGRFFNARGTWEGRAGQLELPPSEDVLELPDGMPLARLGDAHAEWPTAVGRAAGVVSRGRRFDAQRVPIMRYALDDVLVEERLVPILRFGGTVMQREFVLTSDTRPAALYLRLAVGERIARAEDGGWAVAGERDQVLRVSGAEAYARGEAQRELVAALEFQEDGERWVARVNVEVSW